MRDGGPMTSSTSDYVFRDGEFLGDFEGLYRAVDDPWSQSAHEHVEASRRLLAVAWCERLRAEVPGRPPRVLELGCGLGHMTARLHALGFDVVGVDAASAAVERARRLHPESTFVERRFEDERLLDDLDPDI